MSCILNHSFDHRQWRAVLYLTKSIAPNAPVGVKKMLIHYAYWMHRFKILYARPQYFNVSQIYASSMHNVVFFAPISKCIAKVPDFKM